MVRGDVRDTALVKQTLVDHGIEAVVHFAALKAVGESVLKPLEYYENNVSGMLSLLHAMRESGCRRLVFSSSATVYGEPQQLPIPETHPRSHGNPYGHSKLMCEDMMAAVVRADPAWQMAVLRYFNPAGAHPSGLMGEDPNGTPHNLLPYVSQVAVGRLACLRIHGNDYPTPDGTGVRDYIHVMDLAAGHVAAVLRLLGAPGGFTLNLGSGRGHSVLEVVAAFEAASGRQIAHSFEPRRAGDVAVLCADPSQAQALLGWEARLSLADMCADAWRWQSANPKGYAP